MARPHPLLEPRAWDRLPIVGRGRHAIVLQSGRLAIKVAHAGHEAAIADELRVAALLDERGAPIRRPRVVAARADHRAFVRAHVRGALLVDVLPTTRSAIARAPWFAALSELVRAARALHDDTGVRLDVSPANLVVARGRLTLIDLGPRGAPPIFDDDDARHVVDALLAYPAWRRAHDDGALPLPASLPPSGRLHVETAVGRPEGARLFFVHEAGCARARVAFPRDVLVDLTCLSTTAAAHDRAFPSSRYRDSPDAGAGGAKGDGRVVLVGETRGRTLSLKGSGPTALAWKGNAFHEDGLVSFSRALYETAICDELARLGFDVPEVLAVGDARAETVDNTARAWPAATALRAAPTFFRLGHLVYAAEARGEARGFLADTLSFVGRATFRRDFDVEDARHVRAFVLRFARALGAFVGETDGLEIQCFNPTMGNVRVDGPLIDFSTVRFMRRHLPDYAFMNSARRVRENVSAHGAHIDVLVRAIAPLVDDAPSLHAAARRAYARAVDVGQCAALFRFLGAGDPRDAARALPTSKRRAIVSSWRALRGVRGARVVRYTFFEQEARASAFDVGAHLGRALARRGDDAWKALLDDEARGLPRRAPVAAERFLSLVRPLVDAQGARAFRPWTTIVRPHMETEALSDLCYRRSSPEKHAAFVRLLSSSVALDEGRHSIASALADPRARAFARAPFVDDERRHARLVSVSSALAAGLALLAEDLCERALVALVARGPRVVPLDDEGAPLPRARRASVLEAGPDLARGTPLSLTLVVDRALDERTDEVFAARARAMSPLVPLTVEVARTTTTDASLCARALGGAAILAARDGITRGA